MDERDEIYRAYEAFASAFGIDYIEFANSEYCGIEACNDPEQNNVLEFPASRVPRILSD